jgi:AbrB family looped-hinge helix DNA binding protein
MQRIANQMKAITIVDREELDEDRLCFKREGGGWPRLNWMFAGELDGVLLAAEALVVVVAHEDVLLLAADRQPTPLVLLGNTCLCSAVDASSTCSMTSKGQVTIPKALRQQLGLARGSRVCFDLVGDHIEVRPFKPQRPLPASGFGLLKSQRPPVPVDFDAASLLRP